jgi:hypothetical protein
MILITLCTSVVFAFLLVVGLSFLRREEIIEMNPLGTRVSCGQSVAEARQRDCQWDSLVMAWLPKDCPQFGVDDYVALGEGTKGNGSSWTYWQDRDGEHVIDDPSIMAAGSDITGSPEDLPNDDWWWTTEGEHLTHCAWMLIRLSHAMSDGSNIDGKTADFHHTKHCKCAEGFHVKQL